ncbi:carotenoid oxygenase family protein [Prochlorococcus sp. MIT 1223]|uniref:carotenoid oxygenase family protein n=1 Tax=Prochlorococcus sp. MIT 1223 TaxID=3096217 RepID=UPI002A759CF6|nr:carotenoid oxygenase family protein [Prochlorococcus sp. MIT 1223]
MTISSKKINREETVSNFNREDWISAYRNVDKEISNLELKVTRGEVPKSLCGTFYRNGPGQLERGGQFVHHPFDGDGMIASMQFANGKVTFSNRFIRTEAWLEEEKANKFLYRGVFGTQKPGGQIANAFDLRLKNIANTNIIKLGDELLALWEAASPYSLNLKTLRTNGISDLNGVLKKGEAFSAHPRFDPGHNGEAKMVTFGVKTGPKSVLRLMEFANEGKASGHLLSDRKDSFNGFAFLHDFAITPNWAIFLQNAITFNPIPFLLGKKGAAQCLTSNIQSNGKFWLIPRDSGCFSGKAPLIFDAPKGFVFHHLNAFEKDQEIILESIFYEDFPSIEPGEDFRQINFEEIPEGILKRCSINPNKGQFELEVLSNQCCEFAMVNPNNQGLSARFSWMATAERKSGNGPLQSIKKLDLHDGEEHYWSAAPRGFVNEPLMVPNPHSTIEDDGWIVVLTWNGERVGTDLVILKAKDLSEQAVIELPIAIPYGLHGSWVAN